MELQGKKIAVLGYGRIGKYLSKMLKNQGASVFVYARRKPFDRNKFELLEKF